MLIVDDYAHHPTELKASLKGARTGWKERIIAVFQPHLYSRTRDFYHDFGQSFFNADILIVTEIYPAREKPIEGITGKLVAEEARSLGHKNVQYIADQETLVDTLHRISRPRDMIITMGAGDIWKTGEELIRRLQGNDPS